MRAEIFQNRSFQRVTIKRTNQTDVLPKRSPNGPKRTLPFPRPPHKQEHLRSSLSESSPKTTVPLFLDNPKFPQKIGWMISAFRHSLRHLGKAEVCSASQQDAADECAGTRFRSSRAQRTAGFGPATTSKHFGPDDLESLACEAGLRTKQSSVKVFERSFFHGVGRIPCNGRHCAPRF